MADVNRWHRTLERRVLQRLIEDIAVLKAVCVAHDRTDYGQRRMATRITQLIEDKIEKLDEQDALEDRERFDRETSRSEDDIAEELKA